MVDKDMTVKEIVKSYLIKHKFQGLCSDESGCDIEDLFCCDDSFNPVYHCKPAFKRKCSECSQIIYSEEENDEVTCTDCEE